MGAIRHIQTSLLSAGIFVALSCTANLASGSTLDETAKRRLLESRFRPSVATLMSAFDGAWPNENPFRPMGPDPRLNKFVRRAAEMIVQLEYAYPGAVWAPLGRDSAVVADILEAFYLSRGESDRVVRLNASGGSFASGRMELAFLRTNGLISSDTGRARRKFVLLDPTSWNPGGYDVPGSQLRRLLSAYDKGLNGVGDVWRVNAVGLGTSSQGTVNGSEIHRRLDVLGFWSDVDYDGNAPSRILYASDEFAYSPQIATVIEGNTFHLESFWHEPFGSFMKGASGKVQAPPGRPALDVQKEHVLWLMWEMVNAIRGPEFHRAVDSTAARYRFRFDAVSRQRIDVLDDDSRFEDLVKSRAWTEAEIERWKGSVGEGLPPSARVSLELRALELAVRSVVQGVMDSSELKRRLERLMGEASSTPVFAHALASFWKERIEYGTTEWRVLQSAFENADFRRSLRGLLSMTEAYAAKNSDRVGELAVEVFVRSSIRAGTDIGALKKIEAKSDWSEAQKKGFLEAAFSLVRSGRDVLELTEPPRSVSADALLHDTRKMSANIHYSWFASALIARKADTIVGLPGMTIKRLKSIEAQRTTDMVDSIELMGAGLKLVRSRADYDELTRVTLTKVSDDDRDQLARFLRSVPEAMRDGSANSQNLAEVTSAPTIFSRLKGLWPRRTRSSCAASLTGK